MKLLLANLDLYNDYIARGVALSKMETPSMEAFSQASRRDASEYMLAGSDAILKVNGPLAYRFDIWSWMFGGTSYQGLMTQFNAALENDDVDRIILSIDTPGGEVTGLPETARLIKNSSKPVVAVIDPCCASAGVWLASQAKQIVSIESGEVGSLGVQCVAVSYADYLKDKGLDVKVFRAAISPDKNLAHAYEPMSERAVEYLQSRVDAKGEEFVSAVAEGRGVSEKDVLDKFGQGRMLDAKDAVKVGFIDAIGTLADVLAESQGTRPRASNRTSRRASAELKAMQNRR